MNNPSKAPGGESAPYSLDGNGNLRDRHGKVAAVCEAGQSLEPIARVLNSHASLVGALTDIAADGPYSDSSGDDESVDEWLARQGESGLRDHITFLRDKARAALSAAQGGKGQVSVPDVGALVACLTKQAERVEWAISQGLPMNESWWQVMADDMRAMASRGHAPKPRFL